MKLTLLRLLAAVAGRLTRRAAPGTAARVLVIKPDHLGDLLLATPALSALRHALPESQVAGLVGPWSRLIWQGSRALDTLVDLPFPGFDRAQTGRRALYPYLLLLKYGLLLRRERYDAAILLRDDHWWGAALAAVAGIPRRIGHAHPLCAPLLSEALPYDPRRHVTRQALDVVAALADDRRPPTADDQPFGHPPTTFVPTEAEQLWAGAWLAANLAPGERLIVIHPGTGGPAKHWPPARWAAVGDALATEPGARIMLTGGPTEAPLVEQAAALMARPAMTLAGQTSVGQLAALLGRAALVLGVDSGPLHIAVSQGAPTLHLFGPSDHARFGPWGEPSRHVVLRAGLFCSPCGVFAACPRGTAGPECMTAITADTVVAAARRLLG
ncbi:MAG: glycosyltransferase family 9 protein [Chloroflexales bacterium]|nr:glycosyltransferase family 9 protein [Chloroflexales bacterium]